ncbi:MAG: TRAP-type C4-dicarboxylate transport system, small permease component [Rhodobacteraceae bacterium HLUCCA12]|nr:MAG: TRAP-type C4-dicarboxylate transport system, small permease component [Rhodobacteraceae bacterium HLUCCA12]
MERLATGIDRVILWLTRALAALGAACVAAMATLVALAVLMRYAAGAPFAFTEELAGLLMVSGIFLGLPYVLVRQAHIRVGLLYERTGGWLRCLLWVLGQLVFVAFAAIFFRDALADARFTLMLNLRTEVARIDLAPFVIVMTVGVALAGLVAAWQMLRPPPEGATQPDTPEEFIE